MAALERGAMASKPLRRASVQVATFTSSRILMAILLQSVRHDAYVGLIVLGRMQR